MFYIRTGANGSCKTLFTLRDIRDLQLATGRPVAHNGRLKLYPHIEKEFGWKRIDFKKWQDEPDGTIFLVDEVYHDLPPRANGSMIPPYVAKLAEHRSRGMDFFMLCLHPSQFDSFIRKAVGAPGWHQHLKRVAGASTLTRVLQWDAVNDNCQKDGSGKTAQITTRAQPKECYEWYESAFIHTGKVRIPKQVYVLVVSLVLAVGMGWYAFHRLGAKADVPKAAAQAPGAGGSGVPGAPRRAPGGGSDAVRPLTAAEYAELQQPRLPELLHTAPIYDELTRPKRVPLPAACVSMPSKGCKCYTQDGTPYPSERSMCLQIVRDGIFLPFVESPYPAPPVQRVAVAEAVQQPKETAFIGSVAPLLPPPDTRSTVSRDAEVVAFARKREYVK
jgi:zona occludens toxin